MENDSASEAKSAARREPADTPSVLEICSGYRPNYCSELDETAVIGRYVPLVKRIATHLKGRLPEAIQLDDLIQAGLMAILRIMRQSGHAPTGNAALHRSIMNAMIDEARRETWAPVRTIRFAKSAAEAMRTVKRRTGRDGSDEEIAGEMGMPLSEYHRMLVEIAGVRLLQLDSFDEVGEEGLRITANQETTLYRNRILAALTGSIASLPDRERLVVSLYYEHELNMDEIGKILDLNKSTVCRAHGRALLMLRNALSEWNQVGVDPPVLGG